MLRLSAIRWLVLTVLLSSLVPVGAVAQDDPAEIPLGDVARNLRKKTPQAKPIIDDDNLPQVMLQADSHRDFGSGLRFLMSGSSGGFQVAAPDVTCSLSFTANVKSLLSGQYDQMDLPPAEMAKIEGQAVVEGDALTVPIFNDTQWHLSELAVAFTVVKKPRVGMLNTDGPGSGAQLPTPDRGFDSFQEVRPEKKPDVTVIYRMRAAAQPWSRAVFSAPLDLELAPGDEWHWALVQAKGYPPETYVADKKRTLSEAKAPVTTPSAVSLTTTVPETVPQALLPQNTQ